MKNSLRPGTRFGEKKTMICLSQAKLFRKSHHFVYVRALIVRDILRSKDAQCNTEESP